MGPFCVEVEHTLHAGDIFAVELRNTPHVFAPWLEVVFGYALAARLPRDAAGLGELDQFARQQLQSPPGTTLGRSRARRRGQLFFFFPGELTLRSRAWLLAQSRL